MSETVYAWAASPLGRLLLKAQGDALTGLWLPQQRCAPILPENAVFADTPVLRGTASWLARYFAGEKPLPQELPLAPEGSDFAQRVWQSLCRIPYGETVTYGAIAAEIARERGIPRMAAQAVGGAVGRNPIAIIIPCHRVVGTNGALTGYGGGLPRKRWLLQWEGVPLP